MNVYGKEGGLTFGHNCWLDLGYDTSSSTFTSSFTVPGETLIANPTNCCPNCEAQSTTEMACVAQVFKNYYSAQDCCPASSLACSGDPRLARVDDAEVAEMILMESKEKEILEMLFMEKELKKK